MTKYSFKQFFEEKLIHDDVWVTNSHFMIKKDILTKTQLNYVNKFPMSKDTINQLVKNVISNVENKNSVTEFKAQQIAHTVDPMLVFNTHNNKEYCLNSQYYHFIQGRKCTVHITEDESLYSPMNIYNKNLEFVGIVLPVKTKEDYDTMDYNSWLEQKNNKPQAKLMKPLFINGMYNKEGKRIRANYLKTVGEYPLWIEDGKPNKDYGKNENDKYYLYIQVNEWLVMTGYTEYELMQRAGQDHLNKEWYGDFEGRQKYFEENFYKGRTYEEYNPLIKEHIEKEEVFIEESGENETIQANFIKTFIDKAIANYIEARDNNGKFADFIGAAFLDELDKCEQIAKVLKTKRQEKELERKRELAEQRAKEAEEKALAEKLLMEETEQILINGGTVKGGEIIVKIADKYNINIPLRTRGWILNNLAETTITDDGSVSYRYFKRSKNATGSQKVYDVLFDIRRVLKPA